DSSHPDLIAAVAHSDRWNSGTHGLLDQIIDPCAPLAVILPEHVVVCALRRHACSLHGNDGGGTKLVNDALCLVARLTLLEREAEHHRDAAEPLVRGGAFGLPPCPDPPAPRAQRPPS